MERKSWLNENFNSIQLPSHMKDLRLVLIWPKMTFLFFLDAVKINIHSVNARITEYVNCLLCFNLAIKYSGKSKDDLCSNSVSLWFAVLWLDICIKIWSCLLRAVSTYSDVLHRFIYISWCNVIILHNWAFAPSVHGIFIRVYPQRLCVWVYLYAHVHVSSPTFHFSLVQLQQLSKSNNWIKCFCIALYGLFIIFICITMWTH